jgi:transposase-like protein
MGKRLNCPHCGNDYVHFLGSTGVTLLLATDQYVAVPVEIEATLTSTGSIGVAFTAHPQSRRTTPLRGNYVKLTFECESCNETFERVFGFHKGNTYEGTSLDDCNGDD